VIVRTLKFFLLLFSVVLFSANSHAATARIKKVLPQLIDSKERNSLSPSLFERDGYQAFLRNHPNERAGLRFAVLWSGGSKEQNLRLKVELRGVKSDSIRVEKLDSAIQKTGWFRTWSFVTLRGETFENFGDLVAWRVTLWDGDKQISEQKSFLW
jgi:hypothetical protein